MIPFKNTKIEYTSKIKDGAPIKQIAEQSILKKTIDELPMELLVSICSIDGASIWEINETNHLVLKDFASIIPSENNQESTTHGTGTNAAEEASKYGMAIKISEDGDIIVFYNGEKIITYK